MAAGPWSACGNVPDLLSPYIYLLPHKKESESVRRITHRVAE